MNFMKPTINRLKIRATIAAATLIAFHATSCSNGYDKQRNVNYVKKHCGAAIMAIKQNTGYLPIKFEGTLAKGGKSESGAILKDVYGHPVRYVNTGDDSFYFLCAGANGKDDDGQRDDYKVVYDHGWK